MHAPKLTQFTDLFNKTVRLGTRRGRAMLLTAMLLIAQLGIAMHPLHLEAGQTGQKAELACAFCIAGSHLGTAPDVATVHVDRLPNVAIAAPVGTVCDGSFLVTPRLTRGPPLSTPHV